MVSTAFVGLARNQARVLGMPDMPMVQLQHPVGGTQLDSVLAKVDASLDELLSKLASPPISTVAAVSAVSATRSEWIEFDTSDEWGSLQTDFAARGWSDGMLMAPPTEMRVAAMVAGSGLPPEKIIGELAPKMGVATVERIAANAVMAGCRPEHMPILVAAVQIMSDPTFFLKNIQATTHPVSPLLIVGGPLAKTLNINSGSGAFGPGPWANGVIGRAIRLMLLNIGGGKPGEIDKATLGHPGKYTYCIAENEAASPWPSLRAERGFAADVSTVTMYGGEAPHNINDHESTTAGGLLTTITGSIAQIGQNSVECFAEMLVVLSPEHAATIAADGFTKDDVKRAIYEDARVPMSRFAQKNIERRLWRLLPLRYRDRPMDTMVAMVQRWEDVIVIVAGGEGKHSMYLPGYGSTRALTRPILSGDGSPWR